MFFNSIRRSGCNFQPNLQTVFPINQNFISHLLKITGASTCEEIEVIQTLWSGYGKISRYKLENSSRNSVVVKCISLHQGGDHPRGWNTDISHQRKVKSYEVETFWYEQWSSKCTVDCKIPTFIGSFSEGKNQWIILEDLDANFPQRKYELELPEVRACLKWLANFHATFLGGKPEGLWEIGTYWHLATRPDEYQEIEHQELKSKAHKIDDILNSCSHQTIVHGDAKLANFCFSNDGLEVAAVDFQYVGGGCGMKDVAYFLGSCLSGSECELFEEELLECYFAELKKALAIIDSGVDWSALEAEWRRMYPIACTDFMRFLLGWMPSHGKINDYNLKMMEVVLGVV